MKRIFLLLTICIFISSCTVEKVIVDGCTDPYAINYNPEAANNNACEYEADIVFFQDVASALYFDDLGISWLDIYIENDPPVGTLKANLGFTYVPDCFPIDPDAVHFTLLWENSQATNFTWTVRDNSGEIHYSGTDLVLANNCLPMMLSFKKIQEYKEATK